MVDPVNELRAQATSLVPSVQALQVVDDDTFIQAGEQVKLIKAYTRRVGEILDPIVEAAHRAHKVAVDQRKALLRPAEEAETILKDRMGTYQAEQERIRREREAAAERERVRLEAEARRQAEAEEARLRKEAEDRMLEAAAQAEADGDGETAERILAQPLVVDIPVPQPVFMPPVATTMPPPAKVSGVSFRETWTAEVTDFRALVKAVAEGRAPLSLVQADESALGQYARSTRGTQKVPGVRFFPKTTTAVRA